MEMVREEMICPMCGVKGSVYIVPKHWNDKMRKNGPESYADIFCANCGYVYKSRPFYEKGKKYGKE